AKQGLTSPERAVLLAYSKMALFDELLASDLIDDDYIAQSLITYFPTALQEKFSAVMSKHPLKREIIATEIANSTINRTGSVFVHRMQEETGATAPEVVRCYVLTRDVFGIQTAWNAIDALDNQVPASIQNEMLIDVGRLVLRATLWFLRRRAVKMPIAQVLAFFAPGVATVSQALPGLLSAGDKAAIEETEHQLVARGVPTALAAQVARMDALYSILDIVETSHEMGRAVELAAAVYFALGGKLRLRWAAAKIAALPVDTHWQAMARAAMRDDLANLQRQLTHSVLQHSPTLSDAPALLTAWEQHQQKALERTYEVMNDLNAARECDLAMLSVLLRELRVLV
ncbi:MAG: NAD-glutamate dehydrogenase, partial [Betaproteobacteria bacterium]|nr:NAD-glutamate dehydrogenase [Betaproteobacteria bacterium]